jgi:hypothetical protein
VAGLYQDSRAVLVVRYPIVLFLRVVYCRSITPPFRRFKVLFSYKLCYHYSRFWLKRTVHFNFYTGLFISRKGRRTCKGGSGADVGRGRWRRLCAPTSGEKLPAPDPRLTARVNPTLPRISLASPWRVLGWHGQPLAQLLRAHGRRKRPLLAQPFPRPYGFSGGGYLRGREGVL